MDEELDWGPKRPPSASWAGSLLMLVGVAQLGALGTASLLDGEALIQGEGTRIVTASVAALLALQILAAVGVLRLWRWWRGIAMVLCVLGAAVQAANLGPPPDLLPVVALNAALAFAYILVFILLARSGDAFG